MRIVLAPDSFKGSLSAVQVCELMRQAVLAEQPDAAVDAVPMADGGEGTVQALVAAAGGQLVGLQATGPLGRPIQAYIGAIEYEGERCAVLEAASLFGLPMVEGADRNPLRTTSRGLGDAIAAALDMGFRRFIIGLGGSATNDGGLGMLAALGVRPYDADGRKLFGFGSDLAEVARIDWSALDGRLRDCRFTVATDVANPLLGREGATYVYGPQKGADAAALDLLETGMERYAALSAQSRGAGLDAERGAGAAGGLGFALLQLGGELVPGAQVVERASGLKDKIARADWVLTGEGCSDEQTLYGKAPLHVARLAAAAGKPALLVSGSLGAGWERLLPYFAGCFSTVTCPQTLDQALSGAERSLYSAVRNAAGLMRRLTREPASATKTNLNIGTEKGSGRDD